MGYAHAGQHTHAKSLKEKTEKEKEWIRIPSPHLWNKCPGRIYFVTLESTEVLNSKLRLILVNFNFLHSNSPIRQPCTCSWHSFHTVWWSQGRQKRLCPPVSEICTLLIADSDLRSSDSVSTLPTLLDVENPFSHLLGYLYYCVCYLVVSMEHFKLRILLHHFLQKSKISPFLNIKHKRWHLCRK